MGRVVKFDRHRRPHGGQQNPGPFNWTRIVRVLVLGGIAGGLLGYASVEYAPSKPMSFASADCRIKGNISVTGERIYHMPGQEYYNETVISPSKGERYFCSQWDAWWACWRRSKV